MTDWVRAAEVLGLKPALPLYVAVMECEPVVSVEVVKVALPLVRATVTSTTVPSLNVAEPVGVPVVEDFTVAVKVTAVPCVDGFSEDAMVVELAALLVTKVRTADVLPAKLALPA